ncbi:MAG: hypothetical protein LBQ52_02745 [Helicobacteraceae bacterium]|nr:hypothetical protein [Helicobacteraceae bacterium]
MNRKSLIKELGVSANTIDALYKRAGVAQGDQDLTSDELKKVVSVWLESSGKDEKGSENGSK